MDVLVKKIKEKFELSSLPDSLVLDTLNTYLKKNRLSVPKTQKEAKLVIKEVRSVLRTYAGQYASKSNVKNRVSLLNRGDIEELLRNHSSTRERLEDYVLVKKIIKEINPKSVLDLGCGINPIAIAEKGIKYHCYDINEKDLEVVRIFFEKNNIDGDTHHKDIRQESTYPSVDLCLIFKVLDILGDGRIGISRNLLKNIDAKQFIISFATRTLTGKKMNSPYRRWFESILKGLKYEYKIQKTNQEMFYIIKKSAS
jgi:hypothetical protein